MRFHRWMRPLSVAAIALVLSACVDPTTGTPPATGGPPFTSTTYAVKAIDLPTTWRAGCPVAPADLRRISVTHWGYDGRSHQGELVVHRDVATAMIRTFGALYRQRFPIAMMRRVDAYGGSDARSMEANNTSGFNCRKVAGTSIYSEHAYGRAIDLNPKQNPYVKGTTVDPPSAWPWADRTIRVPGMIHSGDPTVRAFGAEGWKWGGSWTSAKDYQHFSLSGR